MIAVAIAAAAPSAASADDYTVVMSPTSVPSGARATVTATITRLTQAQAVGSANIAAPSDWSLVSATIDGPATATRAGDTAQLRNLGLQAGESRVATLTVDAPCLPTEGNWAEDTKQSADFSGPTLNDPGASVLASATTGTCGLTFSTPPANVQIGSTITSVPANPSAPPVAVSVLAANGTPSYASIPITVGFGTNPLQAFLNGTKTVLSLAGVATFGDLSVTKAGQYTLRATSAFATTATSNLFKALNGLVTCVTNVFCAVAATTTGTVPGSNPPIPYSNSVTVEAPDNPSLGQDGGVLSVGFNFGPEITCPNYVGVSPDRELIDGPDRVKTVTSVVAAALLAAQNRQPSSLKTCLLAPYQFNLGLPFVGGVATNVGDQDGDGITDYLGVIPNCLDVMTLGGLTVLIGPPCQVSVTTDAAGNASVKYKLKADPRDPLGRH